MSLIKYAKKNLYLHKNCESITEYALSLAENDNHDSDCIVLYHDLLRLKGMPEYYQNNRRLFWGTLEMIYGDYKDHSIARCVTVQMPSTFSSERQISVARNIAQKIRELDEVSVDLIVRSEHGLTTAYLLIPHASWSHGRWHILGKVARLYSMSLWPYICEVFAYNEALKDAKNASSIDVSQFPPIYILASISEASRLLKLKLDSGGNPNEKKREDKLMPLCHAVKYGCIENVKILLEAGADVFEADQYLHLVYIAIQNHDPVTLKRLLDKGLSPESYNERDLSPLAYAVVHDSIECLKVLLAAGADPNKRPEYPTWHTSQGESSQLTPLYASLGEGLENFEAFKILVDHGADLFAEHEYRKTPMFKILKMDKNSPYLQYLLKDTEKFILAEPDKMYKGIVIEHVSGLRRFLIDTGDKYVILFSENIVYTYTRQGKMFPCTSPTTGDIVSFKTTKAGWTEMNILSKRVSLWEE